MTEDQHDETTEPGAAGEESPDAAGEPPAGGAEPDAGADDPVHRDPAPGTGGAGDPVADDSVAGDPAAEDARPASFDEIEASGNGREQASLEMLYELTMPVTIELGRTTMKVEEVLELNRGSVIQLERLAGEPIDIYVGDKRLAQGEVVVLGEHFGVRLTRILASAKGLEEEVPWT